MKIGNQLQLLSGLSLALIVALLASVAWVWVQVDTTQQRGSYIERLLPLVLDLETRLRVYSSSGATTAADGWLTAHRALLKLLEEPPRLPGEQQILLNSVMANSKGLEVLFGHLRHMRGVSNGNGGKAEVVAHITDRLLVQVETIREDGIHLATLARNNLSNTLVNQLVGVAVIISGMALAFALLSLRITRSLRVAIPDLQTAVAAVSNGRLDTMVREPAVDELAEIARGFNHMTQQLRETMVSRDRLQGIVDERTAALKELANSDHLTGIANRRLLFERGGQEFARARRHGSTLSVVMMDCDEFKRINDDYGHDVGDDCLQHVCQLCLKETRDEDLFARYGGEEFVLLLPDSSEEGAYMLAERIRRRIKETPLHTASGEIFLTISSGVATISPTTEAFEQLLSRADKALLTAKANGRDRTEVERSS